MEYEPDFKCGTGKTDAENGITPEIRARMNADRAKAESEQFGTANPEWKLNENPTEKHFQQEYMAQPEEKTLGQIACNAEMELEGATLAETDRWWKDSADHTEKMKYETMAQAVASAAVMRTTMGWKQLFEMAEKAIEKHDAQLAAKDAEIADLRESRDFYHAERNKAIEALNDSEKRFWANNEEAIKSMEARKAIIDDLLRQKETLKAQLDGARDGGDILYNRFRSHQDKYQALLASAEETAEALARFHEYYENGWTVKGGIIAQSKEALASFEKLKEKK